MFREGLSFSTQVDELWIPFKGGLRYVATLVPCKVNWAIFNYKLCSFVLSFCLPQVKVGKKFSNPHLFKWPKFFLCRFVFRFFIVDGGQNKNHLDGSKHFQSKTLNLGFSHTKRNTKLRDPKFLPLVIYKKNRVLSSSHGLFN